ncbi:hypothetical protein BaRGS_00031923 [Batillaria attramentaria]|uniref:Uncharacterized protein n=1 Tax=Batillaria attramentaria TaxID=370345 RepID=A0ABD0JPA1_9CAEN
MDAVFVSFVFCTFILLISCDTIEKSVLDCFWQDRREVSCDTIAAGYTFNYTVSDHLTLSIPEATEDFVGNVREIGTRLLQRVRNGPETQMEYTGQDVLTVSLPRQTPVTAEQTEPLMSADSSKPSQNSEAVLEQLDEHGAHEDVSLDMEDNKHNANSGRITPKEATPDMFSELSEEHRTSPEVSLKSSARFQAKDKTTNVENEVTDPQSEDSDSNTDSGRVEQPDVIDV